MKASFRPAHIWLWLPFLTLSLVAPLLSGRWSDVSYLLLPGVLALLVSFIYIKQAHFHKLLLGVLCLAVFLGFLVQVIAPRLWLNADRSSAFSFLSGLTEDTINTTSSRSWRVPENTSKLTLTLEAKLSKGTLGWQWFSNSGGFKLEPALEKGVAFTRVTTPRSSDPYLMQTFTLADGVAGQTFRVELDMRSSTPLAAEGCRGVWLQVWNEGGDASCLGVALTSTWQTVTHLWTAPTATPSKVIRVVLNDFDGLSYDVTPPKLFVETENGWQQLSPLLPAVPALSTNWQDTEQGSGQPLELTNVWQSFRFELSNQNTSPTLTTTLYVPPDTTVTTRNIQLDAPTKGVAETIRQSYFFGHPNLAGHVLALLTLMALALSPKLITQLFVVALGFISCFFTGSRTAWLVLLLGVVMLFWVRYHKRKWLTVLYLLAFFSLFIAWPFLGRLQLGDVSNPSSRQDIWLTSLSIARDHFWTGIGSSPQRFSELWFLYNPGATEAVPHAHNILLEWFVNFGIFGGLAILWLFAGFFRIAWKQYGSSGIVIVFAVLALNMADVSVFYAWMLVSFMLYLNSQTYMNKRSTQKNVDFSNPQST